MALAGNIAAIELSQQVQDRFVGSYYEGRLLNAPGESYNPGTTNDATFLANEVPAGTGGYDRRIIYYAPGDVSNYTDGGVGLAQKATVFAHDGSDDNIQFTHAALVWSDKNAVDLQPLTTGQVPSQAVSGTYYDVPFDSTSGTGSGLTIDIVVINNGISAGDFAIEVNKPGYGIEAGDQFTIDESTLLASGVIDSGAGDMTFIVETVFTSGDKAGQLVSVAKTSNPVTLTAGNEAAFYWTIKQYGYYESLLAT